MAASKTPTPTINLLLRPSTVLPRIRPSTALRPPPLTVRSLSVHHRRPRTASAALRPRRNPASPAAVDNQRRAFHGSPARAIRGKLVSENKKETGRVVRRPAEQMEEAQRTRDDFGILAGTAIVVTRRDWPSFRGQPLARAKMEWQLGKIRAIALAARIASKTLKGWPNFFKTRARTRDAKQAAVWLHERFNTETASGNLQSLQGVVVSTLYTKLAAAISKRPEGTSYRWELNGLQPQADVISDRTAAVPNPLKRDPGQDEYVRQAVVRIRSEQSLYRRTRMEQGRGIQEEKVQGQEFDELLVIQKRVFKTEEDGDWKVWGTTEEVKIEDWDDVVNPKDDTPADLRTPAP